MEALKKPILIVLVAGIGDIVFASASLRAFRKAFPDRKLYLLTNEDAAPLAKGYAYLDEVIGFPIRDLRRRKSVLLSMLRIVLGLRRIKFEKVVNLHEVASFAGAVKMGAVFMLLRAEEKIGHGCKGFGLFLQKKAAADTFEGRHRVDAMLSVAALAGVAADGQGVDVPVVGTLRDEVRGLLESPAGSVSRKRIAVNPGGDGMNRRWPSDHFALLSDRLIEELGTEVFFLGGPGEEAAVAEIRAAMKHSAIELTGRLSLQELVHVLKDMDLVISNDSGPMHIAAGLGVPVVAIFGPQDPRRTRPYVPSEKYALVRKELDCSPCRTWTCDNVRCLNEITVDSVFDASKRMLG